MESIYLSQLWQTAAVLAGFQIAALSWRVSREIVMEEEGEAIWATLPDGFVAVSFLILVIGVFVAPVSGSVSTAMASKLFVLAIVVFAATPFVLAGHFNLYCSWGKNGPRPRVTKQEWVATGLATIFATYVGLWILT